MGNLPVSTIPSTSHNTPSNMSPIPYVENPLVPVSEPSTPAHMEFVDFSPAVGTSSLHPIPASADDGATLDWSMTTSDDEKRERKWSLSLSRKSSSEKSATLSRKALVEKQETSFSGQLVDDVASLPLNSKLFFSKTVEDQGKARCDHSAKS
jgi:hypothetical protein